MQRDEMLADLLEQLREQSDSQVGPMVEGLARQHPALAEELRQLWAVSQLADVVGQESAAGDHRSAETIGFEQGAFADSFELPIVLDDYELVEEIGRGGMGAVFKAHQKSLDRLVAVKLVLSRGSDPAEERNRFVAEATAIAQLEHTNIVPIFEVGSYQGQPYFSMPLIEGTTLASELRQGPLPENLAVELVAKVAQAIAYAHQQGVIHRDLKPANILIDQAGEPHLTDFGLAKRMVDGPSLTQTGAILGTPAYMSPEQATRGYGEIGPACDIFSLGALLYALVTGRPPFQASSPVDTIMMLLDQEPLPPRLLNRKLDRELEMIIMRCLQKPPELRYNSASDLAADLSAHLAGEPVSARSGRFAHIWSRMLRDTQHVVVLNNWGMLWMLHAVVLFAICLTTNWFHSQRDVWPVMNSPLPYLLLWGGALSIWAPTFWTIRHRAGPVTAVERQIAHAWGASIAGVMLLFVTEHLLRLPVLTLSPVLGLISGMVFTVKAGTLTGTFYLHAIALYVTCPLMAWMQSRGLDFGITVFGLVAATTFFVPGWKYYRANPAN